MTHRHSKPMNQTTSRPPTHRHEHHLYAEIYHNNPTLQPSPLTQTCSNIPTLLHYHLVPSRRSHPAHQPRYPKTPHQKGHNGSEADRVSMAVAHHLRLQPQRRDHGQLVCRIIRSSASTAKGSIQNSSVCEELYQHYLRVMRRV